MLVQGTTYTEFFREPNMAVFAREIAPDLAQKMGGRLLIGEVGCSTGRETLSLASALAVADVDYKIDAFDARGSGLWRARLLPHFVRAFDAPHADPSNLNNMSLDTSRALYGFEEACMDHFVTGDMFGIPFVLPARSIADRYRFRKHNILAEPLPAERFGAIVMNNMLQHYENPEKDKIMENALSGLRDSGVVLIEHNVSLYKDWADNLQERHNLKPIKRAAPYSRSVRQYVKPARP